MIENGRDPESALGFERLSSQKLHDGLQIKANAWSLDHFHAQRTVCQKLGSATCRILGHEAVPRFSLGDDG